MNGSMRVRGQDHRGSSKDRRKRREWIQGTFGVNGVVRCYWCNCPAPKFEVDRYPICGHAGGSYRRDNIVPACSLCNATRCNGKSCQKQNETEEIPF